MARILILKDEDLAGAGSAGRGRGRQAEGIAEQRPGARGGTWTQGWEDGVDGSPGQDMAGGWGWLPEERWDCVSSEKGRGPHRVVALLLYSQSWRSKVK